ncbi:class I SAM-dependent methyltransferase [Roseateles sp. So40a]|uniref:class I SAM-dependent methyltransferase n=1 Tax=Roseateles sp. So40a TaxID=3400226 RepID=UPI003A85D69D
MNLDVETSRFYDAYSSKLAEGGESPRSAMLAFVLDELRAGAAVLDVGAGSGRDVAAMLGHGLDAYGVEPNASMRARALASFPQLAGRILSGSLPRLGRPFDQVRPGGFDAVVCSAVLMHLNGEALPHAIAELEQQLRGPHDPSSLPRFIFISLPELNPSKLSKNRDQDGRQFFNHDPAHVQELLRGKGMVMKRWETSEVALQSTGTLWHTLVFEGRG